MDTDVMHAFDNDHAQEDTECTAIRQRCGATLMRDLAPHVARFVDGIRRRVRLVMIAIET
jgi:hypothetical protein